MPSVSIPTLLSAAASVAGPVIGGLTSGKQASTSSQAATQITAAQQAADIAAGQGQADAALQGAGTTSLAQQQAALQLAQSYGSSGSTLADAYNQAGQTESAGYNQGAQTVLNQYGTTAANLQPFINTGASAISQLASLFGLAPGGNGIPNAAAMTSALTSTPGYQFGLQQGQQALDNSAASRGMTLSGAQAQAAQQYGTNYAQQQAWAPYLAQLNLLGAGGQSAATNLGQFGATAAGQAGNFQGQAGAAMGASQLGAGGALANAQLQSGSALATGTLNSGTTLGNAQTTAGTDIANGQFAGAGAQVSNLVSQANIANQSTVAQGALGSQLLNVAQQQNWWPTSTTAPSSLPMAASVGYGF